MAKLEFGLFCDAFPVVQGSLEDRLKESNTLVFPNGKAAQAFLDSFDDDLPGIFSEVWLGLHDKVYGYESGPVCFVYENYHYHRMHDGIAQAMWEFHLKHC